MLLDLKEGRVARATLEGITVTTPQDAVLAEIRRRLSGEHPLPDVRLGLDSDLVKVDQLEDVRATNLDSASLAFDDGRLEFAARPRAIGHVQARKRHDKVEMRLKDTSILGIKTDLPHHTVEWHGRRLPFYVDLTAEGDVGLSPGPEAASLLGQAIVADVRCRSARVAGAHVDDIGILQGLLDLAAVFQDRIRVGPKTVPDALRDLLTKLVEFRPFAEADEDSRRWLARVKPRLAFRQEGSDLLLTGSLELSPAGGGAERPVQSLSEVSP